MIGDVRQAFGTILENLRKSSGSGRKSSERRQKQRYYHVYIINRMTHGRLEIWNLFSRVHVRYLTRSLRSLVRYRCEHSKINSISPRVHVLFSMYTTQAASISGPKRYFMCDKRLEIYNLSRRLL